MAEQKRTDLSMNNALYLMNATLHRRLFGIYNTKIVLRKINEQETVYRRSINQRNFAFLYLLYPLLFMDENMQITFFTAVVD